MSVLLCELHCESSNPTLKRVKNRIAAAYTFAILRTECGMRLRIAITMRLQINNIEVKLDGCSIFILLNATLLQLNGLLAK